MVISAKDLRFKLSSIFELLNKGENIIITFRGKKKAKIIPLNENKNKKEDIAFGMWKDREIDVEEYIHKQRKGRDFEF